ncbi:MAG: DUF2188 domain-containing protein [Solirubrobacteraceae bacterium]|nr:DUF2188 domain-containing protein [Solirubrobacteraceae bacterium]
MAHGDIHTTYDGQKWINTPEGNGRASRSAATQAEAHTRGRDMARARGVEHFVYTPDGKLTERTSYPRFARAVRQQLREMRATSGQPPARRETPDTSHRPAPR